MSKYIKTLVRMTELKSSSESYTPFCYFRNLPNRKRQLPCNNSSVPITDAIYCINCIYNKEDIAPKQTRQFLNSIIQITEVNQNE